MTAGNVCLFITSTHLGKVASSLLTPTELIVQLTVAKIEHHHRRVRDSPTMTESGSDVDAHDAVGLETRPHGSRFIFCVQTANTS
ncbi:hypothetical protein BCR44DRAFT_259187 [Catenaria anguillulae PL171]|uniref:Uncharacterized protein n=1 Tax=Catenaria anguillulae PL171 TaxID=765915 RepID=A0A1Y2HP34_9FUNG|nr:hypothetical protein BCR44DRAFT_259187 [Catenaria anguillulae PL171]